VYFCLSEAKGKNTEPIQNEPNLFCLFFAYSIYFYSTTNYYSNIRAN